MGDRERRIKDEAYRIWDEAGRPEGLGDEHWYEAERRIAAGGGEPVPPMQSATEPKAVKPVFKSAGASGVVTPAVAAADAPKPRLAKGAAVDIAPAKSKKPKDARQAAAETPGKDKAEKGKPAKVAKVAKPKSKG